jgi:hypothetical protein
VTVVTVLTFSTLSAVRGKSLYSRACYDTATTPPFVLVIVFVTGDENHASTAAPARQANARRIRIGALSASELMAPLYATGSVVSTTVIAKFVAYDTVCQGSTLPFGTPDTLADLLDRSRFFL